MPEITSICWNGNNDWEGSLTLPIRQSEISTSWTIMVDDVQMGPLEIANDAPTFGDGAFQATVHSPPARGDLYAVGNETGSFWIAKNIRVTRIYGLRWRYAVTFSERDQPGDENVDPTTRPTKWTVETETDSEPAVTDRAGVVLANSAKQLFNPPFELPRHASVIVAEKNQALTVSGMFAILNTYLGRNGKTNNATWNGFPADTLLTRPFSFDGPQTENNISYYKVTYRFAVNPDGWKETPVDQGWQYFTGSKLEKYDDEGLPPSEPFLLDGSTGNKLADNQLGVLLDGQSGRSGPFWPYPQADFSGLAL